MSGILNRRKFFQASAAAAGGFGLADAARANVAAGTDEFLFEVVRTSDEWKEHLSGPEGDQDYRTLRLGETEAPRSSALWDEDRKGAFHCKGCNLHLYDSRWKVPLDKGWAFFRHSKPNSLLMDIDWADGAGPDSGLDVLSSIEVHCRRCSSHIGHILLVDGALLHCINGRSLLFRQA
jgi:peptide-methionine (R)-S-oxide reductase